MRIGRGRCAVIGAANIDIGGFSAGKISMQDSNPGRIRLSPGGVGRNIACALAQLGVEVELIAALGSDPFSDIIRAECARAGVGLSRAITVPGAMSSTYLYIADAWGDMQLAINDMEICDRLTPEALRPRLDFLNAMDAVVVDANLPAETLAWLGPRLNPPIIADAVSTAKAPRLKPLLPWLRALKPNAIEAEALTGVAINDDYSMWQAARALTDAGVGRAFITLGGQGVCCGDAVQALHLQSVSVQPVVSATGAGDAFTAALAWAELKGLGLRDTAIAGLAAASIAIESASAVNPLLNESALRARMERIRAAFEA